MFIDILLELIAIPFAIAASITITRELRGDD